MTEDYHKVNQVVTPIAAAAPDVVLLFKQISTYPGTWNVANDLANTFFSISARNNHQKQFSFSWQKFYILPQGYVNLPTLYHNFIHRELINFFSTKIAHQCFALMTLC